MTLLTIERLFWHCGAHAAEPKSPLPRVRVPCDTRARGGAERASKTAKAAKQGANPCTQWHCVLALAGVVVHDVSGAVSAPTPLKKDMERLLEDLFDGTTS